MEKEEKTPADYGQENIIAVDLIFDNGISKTQPRIKFVSSGKRSKNAWKMMKLLKNIRE